MNGNPSQPRQSSEVDSHLFCSNDPECNYCEPHRYKRKCNDTIPQKQRNHVENIVEKEPTDQKG